jgi:hypothetical protein
VHFFSLSNIYSFLLIVCLRVLALVVTVQIFRTDSDNLTLNLYYKEFLGGHLYFNGDGPLKVVSSKKDKSEKIGKSKTRSPLLQQGKNWTSTGLSGENFSNRFFKPEIIYVVMFGPGSSMS